MKNLVCIFAAVLVAYNVSAAVVPANDEKSASHSVTVKIPSVAMVGLKGGNINFDLSVSKPGQAGEAIGVEATNSDTWLNYSSIVAGERSRTITAALSENLPKGISLEVTASEDAGSGNGSMGKSTGLLTLSPEAKTVVAGIGSCFTGIGNKKGHQLTYSLKLNAEDYATIKQMDHKLTVTYTISE